MLVWELEAKSLSFWTMILASWSFNGGSCHTRCKRKRAFGEVCIAWISQLRKTRVFSHLHLWLFPLLCLALYPLLLHFQGNHCSKSHYFGHITALHSTSPCASSCRVVVVNICRLHSCSGHWKRERDADLTLSQASFTYILTWVRPRTLVIGNVESVTRYSTSSLALGSQLLSYKDSFETKRLCIYNTLSWSRSYITNYIN